MIKSRRFILGCLSIFVLTLIGLKNKTDVSMAIASVAIGVGAANAYQNRDKD